VGCFGGSSPFTLTVFSLFHFWFLILSNSCALGLIMETHGWKSRESLLDGCNKLLNHSRREWMLVCMRLMAVLKNYP
jgi:hypothetical protein